MKVIFIETIYRPLYNALVWIIDILPHADIGFAVIILTILVKIILFPLSKKAIKTQLMMKDIEQPLKDLREQYKDNPQELAHKTLDLYRQKGINPFAGILLVLIQLPIVLALYFIFAQSGFPTINQELLYSFVSFPEQVQTLFLGFIDLIANKSFIIAGLVLITQAVQIRLSLPNQDSSPVPDSQFAQEFMKGLHFQMKYVLPVVTSVISYTLTSVVGLYWIVSNLFGIVQEIYLKKTLKK